MWGMLESMPLRLLSVNQGGTHNSFLHNAINELIGKDPSSNYLFRGIDFLNDLLDQKLKRGGTNDEQRTGASG